MQSSNQKIMKIHDKLRVLDKNRYQELRKLEQEVYKLIEQELQTRLLMYVNFHLKNLSEKLNANQPVQDELNALRDDSIEQILNDVFLNDIAASFLNLTVGKELHLDTRNYISHFIRFSSEDLKLTAKNFNFHKNIKNIVSMKPENFDNKKSEFSRKLSLLDKSIKETEKAINLAHTKNKTLIANCKTPLNQIANIDKEIQKLVDQGNQIKPENITKKDLFDTKIISKITKHKNKISFFSNKKKIALEKLIENIENAKNEKSVSLESLISEWLFTYEKTIKKTNSMAKQIKSAWSGVHQESSTEKFIKKLREESGNVRFGKK